MRLILNVPGARSLKDRRRVVHAFRDRVRARSSVSIAEVGDLERYQVATLGVSAVARDSQHCSELLAEVANQARNLREAVLADIATEVVSFGEGGRSVQGGIGQDFEYADPRPIARSRSDDEEADEP